MRAHYLNALEIESMAENPLSDMERQHFIDTIADLKSTICGLNVTIESLSTSLNFMRESADNNAKTLMLTIKDLQGEVARLKEQLDKVTKERDDLKIQLNRENGNKYDRTSCSRRYPSSKNTKTTDRQSVKKV